MRLPRLSLVDPLDPIPEGGKMLITKYTTILLQSTNQHIIREFCRTQGQKEVVHDEGSVKGESPFGLFIDQRSPLRDEINARLEEGKGM
ncbi:hypothetical protein KM043_018459 [Ampulex compressa]|nr:hypothetical protein KM043_018459 [Ampulex compressa]